MRGFVRVRLVYEKLVETELVRRWWGWWMVDVWEVREVWLTRRPDRWGTRAKQVRLWELRLVCAWGLGWWGWRAAAGE